MSVGVDLGAVAAAECQNQGRRAHVYRMTFTGGHTPAIRFRDNVVTRKGRNLPLLHRIASEMQDIIPVAANDRDVGKDETGAVYGLEIEPVERGRG